MDAARRFALSLMGQNQKFKVTRYPPRLCAAAGLLVFQNWLAGARLKCAPRDKMFAWRIPIRRVWL